MARGIESDTLEVFSPKVEFSRPKVIFVGSNPSTKNTDPRIPFLGTKSWERLRSWLSVLDVKCYRLVNVSNKVTSKPLRKADVMYTQLERQLQGNFLIVALGNEAAMALDKLGRSYFKLPHPSPRNRQLNDFQLVDALLTGCKLWLEQNTKGS